MRSSRRLMGAVTAALLAGSSASGAITASFSSTTGTLLVVGDSDPNVISIDRDGGGRIRVNGGAVPIRGGVPTVTNTKLIHVIALAGNDRITLNEANGSLPRGILSGGDDDDTLIAGSGRDVVEGGAGNDLLRGGRDADVLRGGAGDDTLLGDRGNDRLEGGGGDDLTIWNDGDGSDFIAGGEGDDTVQVNGSDRAGDDLSVVPNGSGVQLRRRNLALFALEIRTSENLDVNGLGGDDQISGSTGLRGSIRLDYDGGAGNDLLTGGDGADTLRGGAGNDTLIGRGGDDVVVGGAGDDLAIVNDGDGGDLVEGGDGRDTLQVNGHDGAGDGFHIEPSESRVRFRRLNLTPFTTTVGTTEFLDVNGRGGNDVMVGSPGLSGRIALDLDGGAGDDFLIGGDGDDTIRGGAGDDALLGGAGSDTILGQDGNDLLIVNHGDGDDFLEGGAGSDTVQVNGASGGGDDVSVRPNGDRLLVRRTNLSAFTLDVGATEYLDLNTLGGDDDVVIADLSGVRDFLILDVDGGAGNDSIDGSSLRGATVLVGRGGDGDDLMLAGGTVAFLFGQRGRDIILGGALDDLLRGGDGADLIAGGGGNDVLDGGDGDDFLLGEAGNDTLKGGDGADILHGAAGSDFGDGGAGIDFAFACESVINVP